MDAGDTPVQALVVPLPPAVWRAVDRAVGNRASGPVLRNPGANGWTGTPPPADQHPALGQACSSATSHHHDLPQPQSGQLARQDADPWKVEQQRRSVTHRAASCRSDTDTDQRGRPPARSVGYDTPGAHHPPRRARKGAGHGVGPVGLEPTTRGLKAPGSTSMSVRHRLSACGTRRVGVPGATPGCRRGCRQRGGLTLIRSPHAGRACHPGRMNSNRAATPSLSGPSPSASPPARLVPGRRTGIGMASPGSMMPQSPGRPFRPSTGDGPGEAWRGRLYGAGAPADGASGTRAPQAAGTCAPLDRSRAARSSPTRQVVCPRIPRTPRAIREPKSPHVPINCGLGFLLAQAHLVTPSSLISCSLLLLEPARSGLIDLDVRRAACPPTARQVVG